MFLWSNVNVFVWSHEDIPGIDSHVIARWLNIDPKYRLVKQKWREFNTKRYKAIKAEVDKLLKLDFIKSVDYPVWWWVCVDFTVLNKACPKDYFLLPRIDQLVDATVGHRLLSFMDAHSSYN